MRSLNGRELAEYIQERQAKQVRGLRQSDTEREVLEVFREYKKGLVAKNPNYGLALNKHHKMRRSYILHLSGMKPKAIAEIIATDYAGTETYAEINRYIREYKKRLIK